jgi:hypothetical protein
VFGAAKPPAEKQRVLHTRRSRVVYIRFGSIVNEVDVMTKMPGLISELQLLAVGRTW